MKTIIASEMRRGKREVKKIITAVLLVFIASFSLLVQLPTVSAAYVEFDRMDYHGVHDLFSSLKVTGTVFLYDGYDQSGNTITFQNVNVPNLCDYGRGPFPWDTWNDIVKSIKVDGTITFFEHINYDGREITFTSNSLTYPYIGTLWNTNPRLIQSYGAWDCNPWRWDMTYLDVWHGDGNNYVNWVSDGLVEVRAQDGIEIAFDKWKAMNFDQGYERKEDEIPNLCDYGWNDQTTEIIVDGSVTLYEHIDYGGDNITLTTCDEQGLWDYDWEYKVSSLKLTPGSRVTLVKYEIKPGGEGLNRYSKTFVNPSHQPTPLHVANKNTITLEAVVQDWYTDTWTFPGWTGAKFDVFAVENHASHTEDQLMIEMYFIRDGANLVWPTLTRDYWYRHLGGNAYNYLIAIDNYPQYAKRTVYPGDVAKWKIDIKALITNACNQWAALDINDLEIVKTCFCLEAAFGNVFNPCVEGSLNRMRLAYTSSGGGGGGCPILHVFDGSEYVEQCLLDIHNADGSDVLREQTLAVTPEQVENQYLLRLVEHSQTHSYIDQVKLLALLEDQSTIQLPLISASHSEDGNVLPHLIRSDEKKAEMLGADHNNGVSQSIDLKFSAPKVLEKLGVIAFIFQIEGNNWIVKLMR